MIVLHRIQLTGYGSTGDITAQGTALMVIECTGYSSFGDITTHIYDTAIFEIDYTGYSTFDDSTAKDTELLLIARHRLQLF